MKCACKSRVWTAVLLLVLTSTARQACAAGETESKSDTPKFSAEDLRFFEQKVRPVLQANCVKCHGGEEKIRGGLRLTSRSSVLNGGDSGSAVALDKPEESLLIEVINYRGFEMPPSGKLPPDQIEILTRWVRQGLPWTPGTSEDTKLSQETAKKKAAPSLDEGHKHWSFQPIRRPELPAIRQTEWVTNPIDAFILSRLEANDLAPSAASPPVAMIRRLCYDVTGLSPVPDYVDGFVRDPSLAAYEQVVDQLLESRQYGEKWGRHWLDLVRFAESNGYERDGIKPFAWRYRDYVIRSLNEDKPYDRFIREQLAGDELADSNVESIIATGYYRLGVWDDEPADPLQARWDEIDDYIGTTSQVFLGITMNCARCHDHKLDPFPQTDYYRMAAFFRDVQPYSDTRDVRSKFNLTDISPPEVRAKYEHELEERQQRKDQLLASMRKIEDAAIAKMPAEERQAAATNDRQPVIDRKLKEFVSAQELEDYDRLKGQVKHLEKMPEPERDLALSVNACVAHPAATHVLIRGNAHSEGSQVEPGFPIVLRFPDPSIVTADEHAKSSGRRTALANWVASPENPLTARVIVNRVWQYHFGRGLVRSSSNFGFAGDKPTHPELIDWLASEFIEGGWKLKRLHKLILMSSTYRQGNASSSQGLAKDPGNDLLWRFDSRRLTAEEIRDSMLAVSGQLNLKMSGPGIYPPIPKEVLAGQSRPGENWGKSPPEEANRRSVYIYLKRSLLVPILSSHDVADTDSSCPIRYTTTVPTQALGMLNGEYAMLQASRFADRLLRERPRGLSDQIELAIRLVAGRQPDQSEIDRDREFILELRSKQDLAEQKSLALYALMLLNTNEFAYLD